MSVLIIEDNPLFATSLRDMVNLFAAQCPVIQVATLEQARCLLLNESVSLVISDIHLPDCTDAEVFEWVNAQILGVPAVLMTGDPALLDRYQSKARHGLWIVAKQVAFEVVCSTVEQAIQVAGLVSPVQMSAPILQGRMTKQVPVGQVTDCIHAFTNQQLHLMELVAVGLSNKEISRHLAMSQDVVKDLLAEIFDQLDVKNRADATHIFRQLISTVQP